MHLRQLVLATLAVLFYHACTSLALPHQLYHHRAQSLEIRGSASGDTDPKLAKIERLVVRSTGSDLYFLAQSWRTWEIWSRKPSDRIVNWPRLASNRKTEALSKIFAAGKGASFDEAISEEDIRLAIEGKVAELKKS